MKPQEPAVGISKMWEYAGCEAYQVDCVFGSADHNIQFTVEFDDILREIVVNHYATLTTDSWSTVIDSSFGFENSTLWSIDYCIRGFINSLLSKLRITYDVWFKGQASYSSSTILSKQRALNYAHALETAIQRVEELESNNENSI